jgi:hypothetical protein
MDKNLKNEILRRKFEMTEDGSLFLPAAKVMIGGVFSNWVNDDIDDIQHSSNIVVNEGLNHILDIVFSNGTQQSTWYVGIYKNNYTPLAGDTASVFAGAGKGNEIIAEVDETVRETYVEPGPAAQAITNTASPASFTANQAVTAYGAFLISEGTMGGLTGVLAAASLFAAQRDLVNTDVLNVTYELQIADA